MPHYDFIEIGTSNFRTCIQKADDNTIGISVEPLSYYINQLPNKKNVIKENVAISFDDSEGETKIFFIPEKIIYENNLPKWLRGCNTINTYHPTHLRLNLKNLVQIENVKQIPIKQLFEKYEVTSLDLLKIDTEGGDCDILLNFKKYLTNKDKSFYPKKIQFETNSLTPQQKLKIVLSEYDLLGYVQGESTKHDSILILK